jgi:hypothetical protein
LSRKIRLAAGQGDPCPTSSPYPSHVERRSTPKSSILCPLNRSFYKTQREERSRGFKKKDEHFQKDHNGLTGRKGEVLFRTNRDNSASLSKLVGLHGSLRPCKNKRRHHPRNKHAILPSLFVRHLSGDGLLCRATSVAGLPVLLDESCTTPPSPFFETCCGWAADQGVPPAEPNYSPEATT